MTPTEIELSAEKILERAKIKGSDERQSLLEEIDPDDLGRIFLALFDSSGDLTLRKARDAADLLAEQAAKRIAKQAHDPDFARDESGAIADE